MSTEHKKKNTSEDQGYFKYSEWTLQLKPNNPFFDSTASGHASYLS